MKTETNKYGFTWGECLVQRTAASKEGDKRYYQILSVYAPNGEIVEIIMTKRTIKVARIPKAKET
jgi:hypothetical protein